MLIKTGETIAEIKPLYGDFEDWFSRALGVTGVQKIDVYQQQPLPQLDELAQNWAGILISGSAAMVSDREDWSERTAEWLALATKTGVPILGICYGHQLLAHALGGVVGPNPRGRQIGTVIARRIVTSTDDPLFGWLPDSFTVQASHSESVLQPPPGAKPFLNSPRDDNFALRFADKVWGIQFHPEFSAPVMREYLRLRSESLRREGLDSARLTSGVTATEVAQKVLKVYASLILAG